MRSIQELQLESTALVARAHIRGLILKFQYQQHAIRHLRHRLCKTSHVKAGRARRCVASLSSRFPSRTSFWAMAGLASKDPMAATRSNEPSRPVRQTRQALRARRAAEAANVAADEPADEAAGEPVATPQRTHSVVEDATQDPAAANDRFPPARRYMPQHDPDTAFTSPASNDFDTQTTDFNMQTPVRPSFCKCPSVSIFEPPFPARRGTILTYGIVPPNRLPRESVGGLELDNDISRVEAPRTQNLNFSPPAAAQQDNPNQADEDEYVSSSSEPEKPIQRRPTAPR